MIAETWETPISAAGRRSLELVSVTYDTTKIVVQLSEETEKSWRISFSSTQGLRITTFESAFEVLKEITGEGGLFELEQSRWLQSLGAGQREYMKRARHFVICCYDQIVEVIAWEVIIEEVDLGKEEEDHLKS